MKTILDVCYSQEHKQYLDIYLPEQEEFNVVLYFHGGGLYAGDKAGANVFYNYMVQQGHAVVSANYRMYPEYQYPDFLVDAACATKWVIDHMGSYGKVKGIYVGGSSAGGYISQMLCFDESWLSAQGVRYSAITGFILDAGQPTCHFHVLKNRGFDPRRVIIDESAPLYHIREDREYAPMLIIVSDNDMQNRFEQTMLLVSTLKHFGYSEKVTLKIMQGTHCAYINAVDDENESVFGKIVNDYISDFAN